MTDKTKKLETIYWNYVNKPPAKDEILGRNNTVYQNVLKKVTDPMKFDISVELIKNIYNQIDQVYFDGLISGFLMEKFAKDLACVIAPKLKTTAGRFTFGKSKKDPELQIPDKVFMKFFSNGEKTLDIGGHKVTNRLAFLIRTIEHELCHLLTLSFDYKNSIANKAHGQGFRTFILNAFGHTDYKHKAFSGDIEVAEKMKATLKIGNTIEYLSKETKQTGIVIKLMAKYLVVDGYNKGISYGNVTKIISTTTTVPKKITIKAPVQINKPKFKIGQDVIIQFKAKQIKCKIVSFTDKRAKVKCDDGKMYYAPWQIVSAV
jgi:hypothetical protein